MAAPIVRVTLSVFPVFSGLTTRRYRRPGTYVRVLPRLQHLSQIPQAQPRKVREIVNVFLFLTILVGFLSPLRS